MMTIADVISHKSSPPTNDWASALVHDRKDPAAYAEVLRVLPSTIEYQAWLALQDGQVARSQELVIQLLHLERAKATATPKSDEAHLLAIELRIMRVLNALGKTTATNKFDLAEAVTEFMWDSTNSTEVVQR